MCASLEESVENLLGRLAGEKRPVFFKSNLFFDTRVTWKMKIN
jgi:hypothetical protein